MLRQIPGGDAVNVLCCVRTVVTVYYPIGVYTMLDLTVTLLLHSETRSAHKANLFCSFNRCSSLHIIYLPPSRGEYMRLAYALRSIRKYSFRFFNLHQVAVSFDGYLPRNAVTQNSPDFNRPGCLPRRAHIQGLPRIEVRHSVSDTVYWPRQRYRNVTIWARVQFALGLKVVAVVPPVMPFSAAHRTALA